MTPLQSHKDFMFDQSSVLVCLCSALIITFCDQLLKFLGSLLHLGSLWVHCYIWAMTVFTLSTSVISVTVQVTLIFLCLLSLTRSTFSFSGVSFSFRHCSTVPL